VTPDELAAIKARAGSPLLLIAHAREDVPALLAEVERLRGIDAEWRRIMARPHPEDACWGAHQMRSQDACMGCERDEARADLARVRAVLDDPATVEAVAEAMVRDLTCEDSCAEEHAAAAVRAIAEVGGAS
jgi:hypothetical protein